MLSRTFAVVAVAALAACGGRGPGSAPASNPGRQWVANTAELIDQLRGDVVVSANAGNSLADARRALEDQSDLYTFLIAYSDFGGCSHMLGNVGTASGRFGKVEATVAAACVHLERASVLFTHAATRSSPQALLAASREALSASPLLTRARLQLEALQSRT